jgi:hypothetical protein
MGVLQEEVLGAEVEEEEEGWVLIVTSSPSIHGPGPLCRGVVLPA